MSLLYNISFKVVSDTFSSKFTYILQRVFIRIGHKFLLYFFIALVLAVLITLFYYKFVSILLKREQQRVLSLLNRTITPVFRKVFRKREPRVMRGHQVFTKKQLRKIGDRKKKFDVFGGKEVKKEEKLEVVEKEKPVKEEVQEEGGYVMWPPKPKKDKNEEEAFDKLSKL